jgi:serine/threonine protein phosphatase PrpC
VRFGRRRLDRPAGLQAAGVSERGPVRAQNQDACLVDAEHGLFAVADGMGGHQAGEVASGLVVEHLPAALARARSRIRSEPAALAAAVWELHELVLATAAGDPALDGMGTTVVVATVRDGTADLVHVGDSRAYLLRAGELSQLTVDHSAATELTRAGVLSAEQAAAHPLAHQLTRAVGMPGSASPSRRRVRLAVGDRLLLCSDGLSNALDDGRIAQLLVAAPSPEAACRTLVDQAGTAGARDNVTAVVVQAR